MVSEMYGRRLNESLGRSFLDDVAGVTAFYCHALLGLSGAFSGSSTSGGVCAAVGSAIRNCHWCDSADRFAQGFFLMQFSVELFRGEEVWSAIHGALRHLSGASLPPPPVVILGARDRW